MKPPLNNLDPFGIFESYTAILQAWSKNPDKLHQNFHNFHTNLFEIHQQIAERAMGNFVQDYVAPVSYDERFQDNAWVENPWFDFLKEYYLLCTRTIEDTIYATPDVPEKTRRRAAFWARQTLNAIAPSNFLWTNPTALHRFITTGGQSLVEGFKLWLMIWTKATSAWLMKRLPVGQGHCLHTR
jgi:polyhydroxyalkanoate synthase subunit PhaC